ncbi:hypothetical protein FRB90_011480 [Tulasnella sp. 427]|nr:hypothetical protein FRB90_011480 [Tulasnella sp. 427]
MAEGNTRLRDELANKGVPDAVTSAILEIEENPELLDFVTGFMIEAKKKRALERLAVSPPPVSPTDSNSSNHTMITVASDYAPTLVGDDLVSEFEKHNYYIGLCQNDDDVPLLMYRTSSKAAPFPTPAAGKRFFQVANKTAHGPWDKVLTRELWNNTVANQIIDQVLEPREIKYSSLKAARFTCGKSALGPIVVWIALHTGKVTSEQCRNASPFILGILETHGVRGAEVEWYENKVERLAGPSLMPTVNATNPTYPYRRSYTAVLSLPVAAETRQVEDAYGTVGIYFHVGQRVFATTNKHVLSPEDQLDQDYVYGGGGAPRQKVRLLGERGYEKTVADTRLAVDTMVDEALRLTQEVKRFLTQWDELEKRTIGHTDWAPAISHTVDNTHHTRDIGVFELVQEKFEPVFRGNLVDLGSRWLSHELNAIFYPNAAIQNAPKFPSNGLLRLRGFVSQQDVANPTHFDEDNRPVYIVGKVGSTTDFTFGRFSDLDAFQCDENGVRSQECLIYNYKDSGDFSAKGDSGAGIWLGDGRLLAILHSGERRGLGRGNHVTYGSPAWFIKDQIETQYPNAVYTHETFVIG